MRLRSDAIMSAQTRLNSGLQMYAGAAALLVVDRASGQANPPGAFPRQPFCLAVNSARRSGLGPLQPSSRPCRQRQMQHPRQRPVVRSCPYRRQVCWRCPATPAHPVRVLATNVVEQGGEPDQGARRGKPSPYVTLDVPTIDRCKPGLSSGQALRQDQVLQHCDRLGCQCRRDGQRGSEVGRGHGQSCGQFPAGASRGGSVRVADFGGRAGLAGHDVSRSPSPTVRLSALVRLTARVVRGLNRASLPPTPAVPSGKAPAVRTAP